MNSLTVILRNSHIKEKPTKNDRLDITHQCILALLDSPVNKSGNLKLYIQTTENIIIEINQETKIPRSLERFKGLLPQLFKNKKITFQNKILLKINTKKLTEILDPKSLKIGLSIEGEKLDKEMLKNKNVTIFLNADQRSEDIFKEADVMAKAMKRKIFPGLKKFMDKEIVILLNNNVCIKGTLTGYDGYSNLTLKNSLIDTVIVDGAIVIRGAAIETINCD